MDKMTYNFKRTFFHRPIMTKNNILFGKIVFGAALVLIGFTAICATFYSRYPAHHFTSNAREKVISRLVEFYGDQPPVLITSSDNDFVNSLILVDPDEIKTPVREFKKQPIRKQTPKSRGRQAAPDTYEAQTIQEAIENISTPITFATPSQASPKRDLQPYAASRRSYERSIKEISRGDRNVEIGGTDFTDFEIISGIRNNDEILGVASENRKLIQHCIDKIYRLYPNSTGNIVVKFDIHPEGYTIPGSVRVIESNVSDPRVLQCVKRSIRRWRNFPRVAYELGTYSMTQKYIF